MQIQDAEQLRRRSVSHVSVNVNVRSCVESFLRSCHHQNEVTEGAMAVLAPGLCQHQ